MNICYKVSLGTIATSWPPRSGGWNGLWAFCIENFYADNGAERHANRGNPRERANQRVSVECREVSA